MVFKKIAGFLTVLFFLQGCGVTGLYEQTRLFPKQEWASAERLNFNFDVADSLAFYNIFFVIRHDDRYGYNNIWLNYSFVPPGDTARTNKIEVVLADAKGWIGSSMDDIVEQRLLLNNTPVRLKEGRYSFVLQQIMREDPLGGVLSAGIRVEKVVP